MEKILSDKKEPDRLNADEIAVPNSVLRAPFVFGENVCCTRTCCCARKSGMSDLAGSVL